MTDGTITPLILTCLNQGRAITREEFAERYERLCDRHAICFLPKQVKREISRLISIRSVKVVRHSNNDYRIKRLIPIPR